MLGFSNCMGPELREFVEFQLVVDLNVYAFGGHEFGCKDVVFDWSESCVEGHRASYHDGEIENFSGIAVYDLSNDLIAEGWMEFIETKSGLVVFWWYLHAGTKHKIQDKRSGKLPSHIWDDLESDVKETWKKYAPPKWRLP